MATKFKIGDKVILGRHDEYAPGHYLDWGTGMEEYVGKVATIVKAGYTSLQSWHVDIDHLRYFWYDKNMQPAVNYPDQKCVDCATLAPHDEPNQPGNTYICSFCRAVKELGD